MPHLSKNERTPLNVTQEARHRIYAGLGWDPNAHISFMDEARAMVGGKKPHHDLDLSCHLFDIAKNHIESVTVDVDKRSDKSGMIYHSGDNDAGFGDGDDEEISAELRDLPEFICHLVFTVSIKSGHSFGEIESPEIHLADGYSNHNFLKASLNQETGKDKSVYLFAHIYREGAGWMLHNLDEFLDAKTNEAPIAAITRLIGEE